MARALWNGAVIAESAEHQTVEGDVCFPATTVDRRSPRPSPRTTVRGWKGTAHYHDVVVGDRVNAGAAWCYPSPKPAEIAGHVAFWRGVVVEP